MSRIEKRETENATRGAKLTVLCATCHVPTNHIVIFSVDHEESMEDLAGENHYQILKCQGCETISFRHESWFSEDVQHDMSGTILFDGREEFVYPKRSNRSLKIRDFWYAPTPIRRIYKETLEAFNNESYMLCAAGLRGLVEGICADQKVVDGPVTNTAGDIRRKDNLEGKIYGLNEKMLLTKPNADALHLHRFLGNEALHELTTPSAEELKLAIEIIEHTLETLYELQFKTWQKRSRKNKS